MTRPTQRPSVAALASALIFATCAIGCGENTDLGPRPSAQAPPLSTVDDAACATGDVRGCKVIIGENNGVLTCFNGKQWCVSGVWTECGDGEIDGDLLADALAGDDAERAGVDELTPADSDGDANGDAAP